MMPMFVIGKKMKMLDETNLDDDNWNIHLYGVYLIWCEQCQELKPCKILKDPYLEELDPDGYNEEKYWCKSCYYHRLYDI